MPIESNDLKNKNLSVMFRSTAVALIITELTGVIAVLIDGIITSHWLGVDVYSGISLFGPFKSVILVIAGFLSTGCNIVCSRRVGCGKQEEANELFNLSAFVGLLISIVIIFLCILFPDLMLSICGVTLNKYPELNGSLFDFMHGFLIGIPALLLTQIMGPLLVMENGKRLYLISSFVLCATDIVGDLLNVFVFKGGAFGMAVATSASYLLQFVVLLFPFIKRNRFFHFSLSAIRFWGLKDIAKNGIPAFVRKFSGALRDIVLNYLNILVALSAAAIAARGIQNDIFTFLYCIPIGISRTLTTMVGIYYGANDQKSLKTLFRYSFRYGLSLTGIAAAACFIFAPTLVSLYTDEPAAIRLGIFSVRWMTVALLFGTSVSIFQHYFQGIGNIKATNLLGFCERFIAPAACGIIFALAFGSKGVLATIGFSEIVPLVTIFIACCVRCKGLPKTAEDFMFLPKDFSENDADNMYAEIQSMDDVIRVSLKTKEFCLQHGTEEKQATMMRLFVEEMAGNVIEHSERYGKKPKPIDFRLFINDGRICFSMLDLNDLFDPTLFHELNGTESGEKHLGIRLVMNMAKEVQYYSTFKSNNLVVYLN